MCRLVTPFASKEAMIHGESRDSSSPELAIVSCTTSVRRRYAAACNAMSAPGPERPVQREVFLKLSLRGATGVVGDTRASGFFFFFDFFCFTILPTGILDDAAACRLSIHFCTILCTRDAIQAELIRGRSYKSRP